MNQSATPNASISSVGFRDAVPIILAYFPIAVTFGVVSIAAGVPQWVTWLISLCVYAGSAQFMMVSLIVAGTAPVSLVITVLLVNLRHILYGTTLGPTFRSWPESKKLVAAFGLTDEVYAVTSSRGLTSTPKPSEQYIFAFSCYGSWVIGTVVGTSIGNIVPSALSNVLSYALPALFIALLIISSRAWPHIISALMGAAIAIIAQMLGFGSIGIVVGAILGATVGMAFGGKHKEDS